MPAKHAARARLFLPFDSLKGFREYLAEKEQSQKSKKMLSEEDCERIDHLLRQLRSWHFPSSDSGLSSLRRKDGETSDSRRYSRTV